MDGLSFESRLGPIRLIFSGQPGCFPGINRPGRDINQLCPASTLRMSGSVSLLPLYAFMALTRTALPLTASRQYATDVTNYSAIL